MLILGSNYEMSLIAILANAGAVLTSLLGLLGLVFPSKVASFVSINAIGKIGISEIRATYGGFFLTLGLSALYTQSPLVFSVVGAAWVSAAIARFASVVIDDSSSSKNFGCIAFEGGIGLLCLTMVRNVV